MRGCPLPYTLTTVVVCLLLPLPSAATTPATPPTPAVPPYPAAHTLLAAPHPAGHAVSTPLHPATKTALPHPADKKNATPLPPATHTKLTPLHPATDTPGTLPNPATTPQGHTHPQNPAPAPENTTWQVRGLIDPRTRRKHAPTPSTRSDARITSPGSDPEGSVSLSGSLSGLTRTNGGNPNAKSPAAVENPEERRLSDLTLPLLPSLRENQVSRRSADAVTSESLGHRRRHGHLGTPAWLRRGHRDGLLETKDHKISSQFEEPSSQFENNFDIRNQVKSSQFEGGLEIRNQVISSQFEKPLEIRNQISSTFEEQIAGVFRDVAYGRPQSKGRHEGRDGRQSGSSRIERTTALSEEPQSDFVADGRVVDGSDGKVADRSDGSLEDRNDDIMVDGHVGIPADSRNDSVADNQGGTVAESSDSKVVDSSDVTMADESDGKMTESSNGGMADSNGRRVADGTDGTMADEREDTMAEDHNGSVTRGQRNATPPDQPPTTSTRDDKNEPISKNSDPVSTNSPTKKSMIKKLLEVEEYDHEAYDLYEGHYDLNEDDPSAEMTRRGDTQAGETSQWVNLSEDGASNQSEATQNGTQTTLRPTRQHNGTYKPRSRISWFDMLLCTNRNLTWTLINFFLGLIMLGLTFLGPYRLLTMRSCTHLLPRTHYVAVHLLVFVAASLKAVYLFHLAYGSRGRLPLILILLLTNTGFPCFSSAFLILMIMMFLAADVQVYKPKCLTVQNIFIFIVMKLVLCFVADVIVGCAHSKSVLVLSRVMLIIVAVTIILVFVRKHQFVLQVSQLLQREFQGELKLLVLPAKDVSQQRQMGIKYILRNHLSLWCRVMKVSAVCIGLLAVVHLFHTIFLISSHVPAWAWWIFHVSGCIIESILAVSTCIAAALTQRYDENISFVYSFLVPPILVRKKKPVESKAKNSDAIYQRVSFSSGTESTQYTTCYPETVPQGFDPHSRTTKVPRRRSATVRRSATFSHAPYQRPEARVSRGHMVPRSLAPRSGSVSQIPIYGHTTGSHLSIYGSGLVSHIPIYSPPSDASVLVHEDGFVRVRTQGDHNDGILYPRGSLIQLQQSHFLGSHPQLQGTQPQHLNGMGRQETFYASLSRRRRSPHRVDILQNNIDLPEGEYHSSSSIRRRHSHRAHLPYPPTQAEMDHHSLSRKRSLREPRIEHLNNMEDNNYPRRRRSTRELRHHHLNNLDRPQTEHRSPTRRQISREDNNDPDHLEDRSDMTLPQLNLYEEHHVHPNAYPHPVSPAARHKISNYSASPPAVSPHHGNYAVALPHSPREAKFPKPFVRANSNTSLHGEEILYCDYRPRGNPVRRNHSSAGYFPSRNMAPPSPSLVDNRKYGSLRLSAVRKRQAGYHGGYGTSNPRPSHRHHDKYPRMYEAEDTVSELPSARGLDNSTPGTHEDRDCPSRQSNTSKCSDGTDQDWALELITSSTILTDFYSLKRPKGKKSSGKDSPDKNSADNDSPAENSQCNDLPVQNSTDKDLPLKNSPGNDLPVKNSPSNELPVKISPGNDLPVKNEPVNNAETPESKSQTCKNTDDS